MNKFDRVLWRINGVLFLLILLFSLFYFSWGTREILRPASHEKQSAIISESEGGREKEFLHLGTSSRLEGTDIFRTPVQAERPAKIESSFSSGNTAGRTRNYLFLNFSDLSSWWLFAGFNQLVLDEHDLDEKVGKDEKRVVATIYEVVTADTDADQLLTSSDRVAAYFTHADGRKPAEIVSGADRILSVHQIDATQVLILYQRGQSITAGLFSLQTGEKIKESAVPIKESALD